MMCSNCNSEVQADARFCSACGVRLTPAWVPPSEAAAREGLVRPRHGRMIGGVCAGFARRYGWDVALVRVLLVLVVVFGCGTPLLAYIIAWIVMPSEPFAFATQPPVVPVAPDGGQPLA
jgi:phage shock protein C